MLELMTHLATGLPRTSYCTSLTLAALAILSLFRSWLFYERYADLGDLARGERLKLFLVGLRLDSVLVSRAVIVPVLIILLAPHGALTALRPLLLGYAAMLFFVLLLAEAAGLYFFRFYDFRPNYIVFEHGRDPEVLKTVRKAYPVLRFLLLSAAGAVVGAWLINGLIFSGIGSQGSTIPRHADRWGAFLWLLLLGFATRGTFGRRPLNPSLASLTTNRIANEIASCGIFNLLYDWSHRMRKEFADLKSVIRVSTLEEAFDRARDYFSSEGPLTNDSHNPLARRIAGKTPGRPLNVVLVVMESFTARLVGCLGGAPALSPELDRLACEGVLFERCYATGERTIQGLEAVVSSFPPLPGAGVVKRPQARQGFATLATILKERGYSTLFFYGGQGIFDHMRAFFIANGFDRFIEEKDFINPVFRGAWGVSDEDLFERGSREFSELARQGRPFFATLLTVSLHSPWQYPPGRIRPLAAGTPAPPGFELAELNNFLYADYAVGKFIREARSAAYFDNTLFVFVGDHGVHLRGRDLIPVDDYLVPALLFAPAHLEPNRVSGVISQIDLPPTIMGILGGEYRSPFFGTNALSDHSASRSAMMIYNKKRYGIVSERNLIVLSENGQTLNYERNSGKESWRKIALTPDQEERSKNMVALLEVAEKLLISGHYTTARITSSRRPPGDRRN